MRSHTRGTSFTRQGGPALNKAPTITYEELLAEVERVTTTGDGWATTAEISKATKRSRGWVLKQLQRMSDEGRLLTGRKPCLDLAGQTQQTPCYKIKPKGKKK